MENKNKAEASKLIKALLSEYLRHNKGEHIFPLDITCGYYLFNGRDLDSILTKSSQVIKDGIKGTLRIPAIPQFVAQSTRIYWLAPTDNVLYSPHIIAEFKLSEDREITFS